MANAEETPSLCVMVRQWRTQRGWSQEELARRSGISRAGVSAIETGRLAPATSTALALAKALGCRVEDLFQLASATIPEEWSWLPPAWPARYWRAEVSGRLLRFPVETAATGMIAHDGTATSEIETESLQNNHGETTFGYEPTSTLVVASCDPSIGILAGELARAHGIRLLALNRSSRAGLELLRRGQVHLACIHLMSAASTDHPALSINSLTAHEVLGDGVQLLRMATWDAGVSVRTDWKVRSIPEALRRNGVWVAREEGSGARQCLDELWSDAPSHHPRRMTVADDHRSVALAIRNGWGDLGVGLRLTAEESGLDFLLVRREPVDICIPTALQGDPRIQSLRNAVRSPRYRALLAGLPGYDSRMTGEVITVS